MRSSFIRPVASKSTIHLFERASETLLHAERLESQHCILKRESLKNYFIVYSFFLNNNIRSIQDCHTKLPFFNHIDILNPN